jgi:hypothetical protein
MANEEAKRKAEAARAAKQERLDAEIRHRKQQLETTDTAIGRLKLALKSAQDKADKSGVLISHLAGFYEEVDKLAKGKALFAATDLIVENANSIIRDAKELIDSGDVYISRLKEFVPAGDNPVYPDILMATRIIQQAMIRFKEVAEKRRTSLTGANQEATTIKFALELLIEGEGEVPTKRDLAAVMDNPAYNWFIGNTGHETFNLSRLDRLDVAEYLTGQLPKVDATE